MQILIMATWMEGSIMYKTYWGMEFNPFDKGIKESQYFHSEDYLEASKRLEHLKNIRGIGLFTGLSGTGKTFSLKSFVYSLNPSLYKVIYLQMTTISNNEFYRVLALGLGLDPFFRKSDNYRQIQERIITLYKDQKITLLIMIDEAQYLHRSILTDLKLLMNFEMDTKNYAMMILAGQPVLNNILSMQIHDALKQRIVINYNFQGLNTSEAKQYIVGRMELCGVRQQVFEESALEALGSCSGGSIRKLNNLVHKALMIGCEQKVRSITNDIIMDATNEIELI